MLAGSDLLVIMVMALIVFGPEKTPRISQDYWKGTRRV